MNNPIGARNTSHWLSHFHVAFCFVYGMPADFSVKKFMLRDRKDKCTCEMNQFEGN